MTVIELDALCASVLRLRRRRRLTSRSRTSSIAIPRISSSCSSGADKDPPARGGDRYLDASAALRRLRVDVDAWPVAPAGLFLVEERTVYLRALTRMTISHELGHAIDCALGGGIYRSSFDPKLRAAFAAARDFVTPYAASGLDEYWAEGQRAYVEMNDEVSPWPRVSREGLRAVDPALYAFTADVFDEDAAADRARASFGLSAKPREQL